MLPAPKVSIEYYYDQESDSYIKGIRLLADYEFLFEIPGDPSVKPFRIRIPEGFLSDGASVPRLFWRLLSPPIDPQTIAPSIVHDYLYVNGARLGLTRKIVDLWYSNALSQQGYPAWKCNLTYCGIRIGGASHWLG